MPAEVFLLTVITDDAGNVLQEVRAPYTPPLAQSPGPKPSPFANPTRPTPSGDAWQKPLSGEEADADMHLNGSQARTAAPVVPVAQSPNQENIPVVSLIEDDPAVIEMFGKDATTFRTQSVRPASAEDGSVEVQATRRGGGPSSVDGDKPVEMTAARARMVGMNVGAGGGNRIAGNGPGHIASDIENAADMA